VVLTHRVKKYADILERERDAGLSSTYFSTRWVLEQSSTDRL
jgi:hypothetical protein